MKRLVIVTAVLIAGCTANADKNPEQNARDLDLAVSRTRLDDGRTVICIVWEGYKSGGISCDWEHAK